MFVMLKVILMKTLTMMIRTMVMGVIRVMMMAVNLSEPFYEDV